MTGKGVPIGNSTIQYRANLDLGELDPLVMDESQLREALAAITKVLGMRLRQELRPERTQLLPVAQGRSRRGFRVLPGLLRLDWKKWARARSGIRAGPARRRGVGAFRPQHGGACQSHQFSPSASAARSRCGNQRPRRSQVRVCTRRCHARPLPPACANRGRGGSASTQAATRVNAEQASKRMMRRPTRRWIGEGYQRPGAPIGGDDRSPPPG